jgi:hypothetical protein
MKTIYVLLLSFFITLTLSAQHTLHKMWDKKYGGLKSDELYKVIQGNNGGYLLCGYSNSNIGGDKTQNDWNTSGSTTDFWVIQIDSDCNKVWDKRFGGTGYELNVNIIPTNDHGYIIGGPTDSDISGDVSQSSQGNNDFWIVKIDSAGNKQWDKRFGGGGDEYLFDLLQTTDHGYILAGCSESGISGDVSQPDKDTSHFNKGDYWIVKIDSAGNKIWDKRYGGNYVDVANTIVPTSDGGYLIGGVSASDSIGDKTQPNFGRLVNNVWILKIDSSGIKLWDKTFGGQYGEQGVFITPTSANQFLVGCTSFSDSSGNKSGVHQGFWIFKIDSAGNKIWDKSYGSDRPADFVGPTLQSISKTTDNGFLLSGETRIGILGDKTEANLGLQQSWLLRIDSAGNKIWDKTIFSTGRFDNGIALFEKSDGCYISFVSTDAGIGGYKTQANWDTTNHTSDYWIIKLCDTVLTGITETAGDIHFSIFPNPTAKEVFVTLQKENLKEAHFTLTNTSGQIIYQADEIHLASSYTKMLDLTALPSGIYLIDILTDGQHITRKIIKQ